MERWPVRFYLPQREEDMGEVKVTKEVTEGVTKKAEVVGKTVKEITRETKVQKLPWIGQGRN